MSSRLNPVSIGQRLLWFMDHYRGDGGVLNCPVLLRFRGPLDVAHLKTALGELVARHEALRTTFSGRGRDLAQTVHDPGPTSVSLVDVETKGDPQGAIEEAIARELATRIDPHAWPIRVTLWRIDARDHVLCFNMHHLVTDGWSCGLIVRDLHALLQRGDAVQLPAIGWQYAEFARWQHDWIRGDLFRSHQEYWRHKLEGARLPQIGLAPRPAASDAPVAKETADVNPRVTTALRALARVSRTTLFNVMLSVYYALLYCRTGEPDLTVASVFANRSRPELHHTVGFFANLLLLRTRVPDSPTFEALMRQTHATVIDAFLHQEVPYYMVPSDTIQASANRPDDIVFQMMTQPLHDATTESLDVEALLTEGVGNRFGFELAIIMMEDRLRAVVSYNPTQLEPAWARTFVNDYACLAAAVADAPRARLTAVR